MKKRSLLFGLAFLWGTLAPFGGGAQVACAGPGPHAALVVDTSGHGVLDYCVALDAPHVSGLHVIELAHSQYGLSYGLGFGGQAVCMLAGVGPTGDDCFQDYPDFWGYWRGDGSGGWTWSAEGAGATVVTNGGVEGWSWGPGQDGATHEPPPATSFGAVCRSSASQPSPSPRKTARPHPAAGSQPSQTPSPTTAGRHSSGRSGAASRQQPGRAKASSPRPSPAPSGDRATIAKVSPRGRSTRDRRPHPGPAPKPRMAAPPPGPAGGPPRAGVVGLVGAVALGAVGFVLARRRRGSDLD